MRAIDADELKKCVLKWLPEDPCGREEKEMPFETDICVSMLMEIDEQPTIQPEPHWIPCSEDFPKAKQKVLVQYADGSMATKKCNDEGHLQWFYANAVAWMPAPEPYKGENNESN